MALIKRATIPDILRVLAINWDYEAPRFWDALYELRRARADVPAEIWNLDEYDYTLPMAPGRFAVVRAWCERLPEWKHRAGWTALTSKTYRECLECKGTGFVILDDVYGCRLVFMSREYKCKECNGLGHFVA